MVNVTGATSDDIDGTYNVMVGSVFTITCTLNCPTTTNVTWRQNDTVISSLEAMMTPDGFSVTYALNDNLEIMGSVLMKDVAEPSDSATYQCGTTVQTIQSNNVADIFVYSKCLCTCEIVHHSYHPKLSSNPLFCHLSIAMLY